MRGEDLTALCKAACLVQSGLSALRRLQMEVARGVCMEGDKAGSCDRSWQHADPERDVWTQMKLRRMTQAEVFKL